MCLPPGRSGLQNSDVSVGALHSSLSDPFQRLQNLARKCVPSSELAGTIEQVLRVVMSDSGQCQLLAGTQC